MRLYILAQKLAKKGVSPVLLALEETHITTTLGLGVGVLSIVTYYVTRII